MEFEVSIEQFIHQNVIAEIYQNQENRLYGVNVRVGKLNLKFPPEFEDLESLKKILSS